MVTNPNAKKTLLPFSPIIMELENGGLEDDFSLLLGAIFHFHDYGRKGRG